MNDPRETHGKRVYVPPSPHGSQFNDGWQWRHDPWRYAKAFAWLMYFLTGVFGMVLGIAWLSTPHFIIGFVIVFSASLIATPRRGAIV